MTIISLAHRFIFIKTRRVGGTSVEAALRASAGPDDILTPFTPRDELHCIEAGLPARNYAKRPADELEYTRLVRAGRFDEAVILRRNMKRRYHSHMAAGRLRRVLGRRRFTEFYRFTIERDPLSWLISVAGFDRRGYDTSGPEAGDLERLRGRIIERLERPDLLRERANYGYYTIRGRLAVDRVLRYDNLEVELAEVIADLGLEALGPLPRFKRSAEHPSVTEVFTPELERLVRERFEPVFELLGDA